MAFQSLGVANSPLGRYIESGFNRLQQKQMQAGAQKFQAGENLLGRQHQVGMQEDAQAFQEAMDATQWQRSGKPQLGMQQDIHGLQTEQMRGVRSSNVLNDLIQQQLGAYGKSLYDPIASNVGMQDGAMSIPQQIKDVAGMSSIDMAQGLTQYMQGQDLGLDEVQQRELAGKVNAWMSGLGGGQFRKGVFGDIRKDVLADIEGLGLGDEPELYSDLWEKTMTPHVAEDWFNPFSMDNEFLSQLEFTKKDYEGDMQTKLGKTIESVMGVPADKKRQAQALRDKYIHDYKLLRGQ